MLTIQDTIASYIKFKYRPIVSNISNTNIGGITGPKGDSGNTGSTGNTGPIGPNGDTGPNWDTGHTGHTGPQGISNYSGTSYRDTTTLTFVQNNGTVYYKASLTAPLGSLSNYNELGSVLNVPGVNFTYISIIYSFNGTPTTTPLNFGIIDMSNTVLQYTTFPSTISTLTPRCLRVAIYNGIIGGSNYINIRSVILGFN